ncbi:MAG TPA: hypothetical protein VJ785_02365 [Anaerolineales bacterium]|nr:hypothetical protein [Anaerolineales bacterium]
MANSEPPKKIDPTITAAIIGVVGTIIVTMITVFGDRLLPAPQPTATPVVPTAVVYTETVSPTVEPTDTVPPNEPTSTPEPPTHTPTPLPTATLIPAGADWLQNCISSVWLPYPSTIAASPDDKGCLIQLVGTFYTNGGRLAYTVNQRVESRMAYGLFTKLPSSGSASLKFHLSQLTRGEILIGIFEKADVDSKGVVLVVPAGKSVEEQDMAIRTMPDKTNMAWTSGTVNSETATYDVVFEFDTGNVNKVRIQSSQYNFGPYPVVSAEKYLFIGYHLVTGGMNNLQAEFFDLVIP